MHRFTRAGKVGHVACDEATTNSCTLAICACLRSSNLVSDVSCRWIFCLFICCIMAMIIIILLRMFLYFYAQSYCSRHFSAQFFISIFLHSIVLFNANCYVLWCFCVVWCLIWTLLLCCWTFCMFHTQSNYRWKKILSHPWRLSLCWWCY